MKNIDILKAMDCLTDLELEEAEMKTERKSSRYCSRVLKICLAAAAAAAVMVGTAVAAGPLYRSAGDKDSVSEGPVNEHGAGTKIIRTESFKSDFFSDDIVEQINYARRERDAIQAGREFSELRPDFTQPRSWDEAQRMLGIDLLDSAVLDDSPAASYMANRGEGAYHMEFFSNPDGTDQISVYRDQYVDGVNVQFIASVFVGEDGVVERQVPYHPSLSEPGEPDDPNAPEPVGRVLNMKYGKSINWDNYGANDPYNQIQFLESGAEYEIIFKSSLWDDPDAAGYTHPENIDYDGIVVNVVESLDFFE